MKNEKWLPLQRWPFYSKPTNSKTNELNNEEAICRDCREGVSSGAHSIPDSHHDNVVRRLWTNLLVD